VLPDSKVLVAGGKRDKDSGSIASTFIITPETGVVTESPPMLYGHSSHTAILADH
jgi:hypothetical protein